MKKDKQINNFILRALFEKILFNKPIPKTHLEWKKRLEAWGMLNFISLTKEMKSSE